MRITFFKTGRPKEFNYTPRYYDEQKEEREDRQKRIEQELGITQSEGAYRSRLKPGIMSERLISKRKINRGSTLRLLVLIVILTILALYFLRDYESLNSIFK